MMEAHFTNLVEAFNLYYGYGLLLLFQGFTYVLGVFMKCQNTTGEWMQENPSILHHILAWENLQHIF